MSVFQIKSKRRVMNAGVNRRERGGVEAEGFKEVINQERACGARGLSVTPVEY